MIIFATKCWGKDYHKFLQQEFQNKKPSFNFDKNWLLINNRVPIVKFNCGADFYIKVDKYANKALKFFNLEKNSFRYNGYDGYVYSIAELVLLYLVPSIGYLCYIQGDVQVRGDWITPAIKILENEPNVSVVSPLSAVNTWHNKNGYDYFFSDQAFVIRIPEFKQQIYFYKEPILDQYPFYAGNPFERMIGRYLHNTKRKRKILKEFYAYHS